MKDLEIALTALERGDFLVARRVAKAVLESDASADVRAQARDVLSRTGVDRVVVICLALFAAAFAAIFVAYTLRG